MEAEAKSRPEERQPNLTCLEGGLTIPTSYTEGPYRAQLVTAIRGVSDFSRASDAVVAFEALRRLGYGEELKRQLDTRLSVLRTMGQTCDMQVLTKETEKAKEEILNGLYPNWRKLVQSN